MKIMSELTKSFEQDFPLPFHIEEDETGQLRTLCPASGTAFMDFGIVEGPLDFDGYDVQEYLVKCANLMPEAVEIIKMACFSPCRDLCKYAKNGAPSVDVPECDYCPEGACYERAKAFLAKLEGGNDNEPR